MSDPADIQAIMENCKDLKGAADHMEKYSVCYDITKEERDKIKELVNSAKKKSQNFQKWDFKVTRNKEIPKKGQINKDTHKKRPQNRHHRSQTNID